MTHTLRDKNRQLIFKQAITSCNIKTYIECGAYHGDTMNWFSKLVPHVLGCEVNPAVFSIGCKKNSHVNCVNEHSLDWLPKVELDVPLFAHLDSNWVAPSNPFIEEIGIINRRWPGKSCVIVNTCYSNRLHKKFSARPWHYEMLSPFKEHATQLIVPIYRPDEEYVLLNFMSDHVKFDPKLFEDRIREL